MPIKLSVGFTAETLQTMRKGDDIVKVLREREKNLATKNALPGKTVLQNERKLFKTNLLSYKRVNHH